LFYGVRNAQSLDVGPSSTQPIPCAFFLFTCCPGVLLVLAVLFCSSPGISHQGSARLGQRAEVTTADEAPQEPPIFWNTALLFVAAIFVLYLLLQPLDLASDETASVAGTLFQVTGTIAALLLPVAELTGNRMNQGREQWMRIVINEERQRRKEAVDAALEDLGRLRDFGVIARRSSLYLLCAFFLSTAALFTPGVSWSDRTKMDFYWVDNSLIGGALGFMVVGLIILWPFLRYLYAPSILDRKKLRRDFEAFLKPGGEGPSTLPIAPRTKAGSHVEDHSSAGCRSCCACCKHHQSECLGSCSKRTHRRQEGTTL
jgi:hypothetical protein